MPSETTISCLNCGGDWPGCGCESYGIHDGVPIIIDLEDSMPSKRDCTCPPGGMTPHEEGCDYLAGFMTEREAAIFAYLYTIAEPPGDPAPSAVLSERWVSRQYLKEKLDWLHDRILGGGDMFANLDPARKGKALAHMFASGILSLDRAAQAIGADPETLRDAWSPSEDERIKVVDALVEKIWERFIVPGAEAELKEGFLGAPVELTNVAGAAAAIVKRAMLAGNVPTLPVIIMDAPAPTEPFVRVTAKPGKEEGEVMVTLEGPPWIAALMPERGEE